MRMSARLPGSIVMVRNGGKKEMKIRYFTAVVLLAALLILPACREGASETTQQDTKQETDASAGDAASEGRTVSPLPAAIDPGHPDDCTVAVSFEKGDAFVDDNGMMQLRVRLYVYDLYDMVDISMLQEGDRITVCRQDVQVESLERRENGAVVINGGLENGGSELVSDDETVFHAVSFNDLKLYYEIGEAMLPVSSDFVFEDESDPEKGSRIFYPGDFLTDNEELTYHFVPNNTTITVQDGYVVSMLRVYNP